MSDPTTSSALYVDRLSALYCVLMKVRSGGLMAIETDAEHPERETSIFAAFPRTLEQPYLEFASDLLCLCVSGNLNTEELKVYVDHAITGHAEEGRANLYLLKAIWLTIWASANGYAPRTAVEFGRQAIPVRDKPSRAELERVLRDVQKAFQTTIATAAADNELDSAVERFIASLHG